MDLKRKSLLGKLHTLLDESVALAREARTFLKNEELRRGRGAPDFYGPRGTEVRLTPPSKGILG